MRGRVIAAIAAAAIAIAIGFALGQFAASPDTSTVASPHVLTAPPGADARVEAQREACPDRTAIQPRGDPERPASPDCVATLAPEQLQGAITPPPSIVHAGPGDPPNGQFPSSALAPATGCSRGLAKNAAAAWNHVAVQVHEATGYWLQSNGDASCYRTFAQQVELRNYWCNQGNCSNAAVPGTSNHGWGLAIDAPPQTVSAIHRFAGGLFGQGYGSCSDAPWEGWHVKYCGGYSGSDPGPYGQKAAPAFKPLSRGSKGKRVKRLSTQLALLRRPTKGHPHYIDWQRRGIRYDKAIAFGVRKLQRDCKLPDDGVYGEKSDACMEKRWRYHLRHRR